MIDILSTSILIIFCCIISFREYSQFRTFITPFNIIAWPYTIIVTLINCIGKYFGFFSVSMKSIFYVIICLSFFVLAKPFIKIFFSLKTNTSFNHEDNPDIHKILESYRTFFIVIAYISIIAGFIHLYFCIKEFGWYNIASYDFREAYGSGILSHIMLLSRPSFIFIFAYYLYSKKKSLLLPLLLIFFIIIIRQVKYHVIVLLLGSLYFSFSYHLIRISFKRVFYLVIITYIIFNLSYTIGFSTLGISHAYSSKVQSFLFNHFFTYLFGGPIGFSEILKDSTYPLYSLNEIFAVPINFIRILNGRKEFVDIIINHWIPVSSIHKYFHTSNVYGLFGMLYAYIGTYLTFIYLFVWGIIIYSVFYLNITNKYRIDFKMVFAFISGYLTLSFFGLYFNMLSFFEVTIYILLLPSIFRSIKRLSSVTYNKYKF